MKNKLILGLISASIITGSAFADKLESMEGLTTSRIICESGVEGFVLSIVRENAEDAVLYESCSSDGIDVERKELVETRLEQLDYVIPRLPGDFVTLGGTEYYFPNGYTEPTSTANNTCTGGYYTNKKDFISCRSKIWSLHPGWLNLVESYNLDMSGSGISSVNHLSNLSSVKHSLNLHDNYLSNVNSLLNLTYVGDWIDLRYNNNRLNDISGLNNLEYVGSYVMLDNKNYSVKLDADSYLCQNFYSKVKRNNGVMKSQVCYAE